MQASRGAAALGRAGARLRAAGGVPSALAVSSARALGGKGVPDQWGQPATGGTKFLGTPDNYMQLLQKRPISPDLFGVEGGTHYKFPPVALSSITNRVTGVVLSGVIAGGASIGLVGDLPAVIALVKSAGPALMIPLKFCVSFPLVFHTLGGYRHLFWDFTQRGIDNASADASSKALFAGSFAASAALALLELPPA